GVTHQNIESKGLSGVTWDVKERINF
ncbi:MAG: hypothetical protein JWO20_3166, partial [Candidatus Angelobacter sp.]|nr:hypothetical protein [Candidatus Angelobacter sp.]